MKLETFDREQRFASLYESSYGRIHAYASRRVGAEAADEIAAETFLVAWRRFDDVPGEPLPWLYGVARNVVMRQQATQGRQQLTQDALVRERPWVHSDYREVEHAGLWEAWHQLRSADREVLALVAWEELSVADAAHVVGCSAPVFSVRLHRARRRLERRLADRADDRVPSTRLSEV